MGRRIRWLGLVLVICFVAVIAQLVNIQVREAPRLDAASTNPRNAELRLDNYRGEILAAGGTVLARSAAVPNRKSGTLEYYRTYPGGFLYSGIVGFDSEFRGTAGVEDVYNTQLSLHSQPAKTLGQVLTPPPPSADDVTLTVQPTLQQAAYNALGKLDGAVVVLNPKTGAVLAMYSNPTFTPNALAQPTLKAEEVASKADFTTPDAHGYEPGQPLATFDRFFPGSTYKVVTTSAVYNLKPTLSNFTWGPGPCTKKGTIPGTTNTVCNDADTPNGASVCGGTIREMLPESCDPGYVMLGLAVGATAMYKQSELFGVNSVPPIDLTSRWVSKSYFPTPKQFVTGTGGPGRPGLAYAGFGQGTVTLTPLQNALNAAAIANTGAEMAPHVMSQIRNAQGGLVEQYKPTVYKQALSAPAAQQVKAVMEDVVSTPHGTAYGVFTPADQVAAKTGTAQITTANKLIDDWMIAFAPASDPTVAVAVAVPYQGHTTYGATTAGPIASTMIKAALAEQRSTGLVPTTTPTTTTPLPATTTTTAAAPPPTTTAVPPATPTPTATTVAPATANGTTGAAAKTASKGPAVVATTSATYRRPGTTASAHRRTRTTSAARAGPASKARAAGSSP